MDFKNIFLQIPLFHMAYFDYWVPIKPFGIGSCNLWVLDWRTIGGFWNSYVWDLSLIKLVIFSGGCFSFLLEDRQVLSMLYECIYNSNFLFFKMVPKHHSKWQMIIHEFTHIMNNKEEFLHRIEKDLDRCSLLLRNAWLNYKMWVFLAKF